MIVIIIIVIGSYKLDRNSKDRFFCYQPKIRFNKLLQSLVYARYHTENTQESNEQNYCGRKALKSRGMGTTREALLGEDKIEWY